MSGQLKFRGAVGVDGQFVNQMDKVLAELSDVKEMREAAARMYDAMEKLRAIRLELLDMPNGLEWDSRVVEVEYEIARCAGFLSGYADVLEFRNYHSGSEG